jgi:hypothetical protein
LIPRGRNNASNDNGRNLQIRIAFQAEQMQASHLRKELESTRNAGNTPAMTLVANDVGRLAGREWFPPQTGFEAQPDEHGHRPGLAL